jgi:hypothetical protein
MAVANLFDRLAQNRLAPAEAQIKRPRRDSPPMLLDWLRNRWPKTTVSARDIYRHGPNPVRDRKIALNMAEALVGQGWLTPIKTFRQDRLEWRIVGKSDDSDKAA